MALPRDLRINFEPDFTIPKIEMPKMCEHKVLVLKKKKNYENDYGTFNFNDKTYKCLECNQIFYINVTNNIKMIKN